MKRPTENRKAQRAAKKQRVQARDAKTMVPAPARTKRFLANTLDKHNASKRQRTVVKMEAVPPLFQKIQVLCNRMAPELVKLKDLTDEIGIDQKNALDLVNKLSKKGFIAIHNDNGIPCFRWLGESERKTEKQKIHKLKGLSDGAKLVYQEIENAGNRGLGVRDLKFKTNLQGPALRKCLETMAAKNLIKWVHTIDAKNKKIWMLKDLEPSRDVKGGPWYNDEGQFDPQEVENLFALCKKYLESGPKTSKQVLIALKKLPMVSKKLNEMDVEYILNALSYDGVLEGFYGTCFGVKQESGLIEQKYGYRIKYGGSLESPITDTPCCTCPVAEKCAEGQEINPSTCKYLESWMNFDETDTTAQVVPPPPKSEL